MKIAGLTTLGNSLSGSLGILFSGWFDLLRRSELRTLFKITPSIGRSENRSRAPEDRFAKQPFRHAAKARTILIQFL